MLNDVVLSAIVFVCGAVAGIFVGRWLKLHPGLVAVLIVWHAGFAAYYANYVLLNGGDAFVYYQKARFDFVAPSLGTEFVVWLTSYPVGLGFTYWPTTLLFNAIGTIGLLFFGAAIRETGVFRLDLRTVRLAALVCLFVPSLSFWTSGIGKDAIAFLSVGMFVWAAMHFGRRQPAAIAAVLIMFLVRPHISALMVLSVAAGTIFVAQARSAVRFSGAALATAGAVFAMPLALSYSGATEFSSITQYLSERQEANFEGGSSIDIRGMNPAMRMLSFVYRPLPHEASGIDQLAASMDNLFLIALTVAGLVGLFRASLVEVFQRNSINVIFAIGGIALLSQVTANLGLASRQKWMMLPALMIVMLSAWTMANEERTRKRSKRRSMSGSAQAVR